jgi:hypothetical protein
MLSVIQRIFLSRKENMKNLEEESRDWKELAKYLFWKRVTCMSIYYVYINEAPPS